MLKSKTSLHTPSALGTHKPASIEVDKSDLANIPYTFKKGNNQTVGDITTSTLFIWGKKDLAIGKVAAENNHKYMKGDYTLLAIDGGHWLMQTNYPEIEIAIIDHITKY